MLTKEQENLIGIVKRLERKSEDKIPVGPELADIFGRKLILEGQAISESSTSLSEKTLALLKELQTPESEKEKVLRGQVMWYDVRSSVWKENPELSALMALAYAQVIIERTNQKTGHTINIAVDCYKKHFESMSVFVDTIIRTGIVKDGGGVIYWGVQNGGSIRNVAEFEKAVTRKNGNWVFGTMSHRAEDYVGAKFGMFGQVFCGKDLMEDMYSKLIAGNYPELEKVDNPSDYVVTVGDLTLNNIDIVEDLIRARTGSEKPREEILSGMRLSMNMCGSPVGKNLLDMVKAFGADVEALNDELNENYSTSNIVDPNEHESEHMEHMKERAKKDGRIYLALDPDGDRGTVIALNGEGEPESLTGTELLLLATENLATYNPDKLPNEIVYDMRTGVSILMLQEALAKAGNPVEITASEPGYPFFMEIMGKHEKAVIAVENTSHQFLTPMTNPIWGAPKYYPGVQGGDDAAVFLVYILGLCHEVWEGRNPVQELEYLRKKFNIPKTIIREFKPTVSKEDAQRKYDLAEKMCEIAEKEIKSKGSYEVDTMNSGVRLTSKERQAMVLIRYSNTGPSFTASGEAVEKEDSDFMFTLGGAVMNKAVIEVKKEKGDFSFDFANFSEFADLTLEESQEIIDRA
jgi:phosphomannomutase